MTANRRDKSASARTLAVARLNREQIGRDGAAERLAFVEGMADPDRATVTFWTDVVGRHDEAIADLATVPGVNRCDRCGTWVEDRVNGSSTYAWTETDDPDRISGWRVYLCDLCATRDRRPPGK